MINDSYIIVLISDDCIHFQGLQMLTLLWVKLKMSFHL
jgi:hypothetical protein